MLIAVLSGFITALLLPLVGKFLRGKLSLLFAGLPILLFAYFLTFVPQIAEGGGIKFNYNWIPSHGINLDFNLDGLALLFALLITGIGSLVFHFTVDHYSFFKGFFCIIPGTSGIVLEHSH